MSELVGAAPSLEQLATSPLYDARDEPTPLRMGASSGVSVRRRADDAASVDTALRVAEDLEAVQADLKRFSERVRMRNSASQASAPAFQGDPHDPVAGNASGAQQLMAARPLLLSPPGTGAKQHIKAWQHGLLPNEAVDGVSVEGGDEDELELTIAAAEQRAQQLATAESVGFRIQEAVDARNEAQAVADLALGRAARLQQQLAESVASRGHGSPLRPVDQATRGRQSKSISHKAAMQRELEQPKSDARSAQQASASHSIPTYGSNRTHHSGSGPLEWGGALSAESGAGWSLHERDESAWRPDESGSAVSGGVASRSLLRTHHLSPPPGVPRRGGWEASPAISSRISFSEHVSRYARAPVESRTDDWFGASALSAATASPPPPASGTASRAEGAETLSLALQAIRRSQPGSQEEGLALAVLSRLAHVSATPLHLLHAPPVPALPPSASPAHFRASPAPPQGTPSASADTPTPASRPGGPHGALGPPSRQGSGLAPAPQATIAAEPQQRHPARREPHTLRAAPPLPARGAVGSNSSPQKQNPPSVAAAGREGFRPEKRELAAATAPPRLRPASEAAPGNPLGKREPALHRGPVTAAAPRRGDQSPRRPARGTSTRSPLAHTRSASPSRPALPTPGETAGPPRAGRGTTRALPGRAPPLRPGGTPPAPVERRGAGDGRALASPARAVGPGSADARARIAKAVRGGVDAADAARALLRAGFALTQADVEGFGLRVEAAAEAEADADRAAAPRPGLVVRPAAVWPEQIQQVGGPPGMDAVLATRAAGLRGGAPSRARRHLRSPGQQEAAVRSQQVKPRASQRPPGTSAAASIGGPQMKEPVVEGNGSPSFAAGSHGSPREAPQGSGEAAPWMASTPALPVPGDQSPRRNGTAAFGTFESQLLPLSDVLASYDEQDDIGGATRQQQQQQSRGRAAPTAGDRSGLSLASSFGPSAVRRLSVEGRHAATHATAAAAAQPQHVMVSPPRSASKEPTQPDRPSQASDGAFSGMDLLGGLDIGDGWDDDDSTGPTDSLVGSSARARAMARGEIKPYAW